MKMVLKKDIHNPRRPKRSRGLYVRWTGQTCEEGFITNNEVYEVIREYPEHYEFYNDHSGIDRAHKKYFTKVRRKH